MSDLNRALDALQGSATTASKKPAPEVIPLGIPLLDDYLFGCGGLPRGRVIEIYAKESVGKSTFSYWLAGVVQKAGGVVALFDAEGTYLADYGAKCGIDNDKLILPIFTYGEEALDQMKMLVATNSVDLIIGDAMPSFQPKFNMEQIAGERITMNKKLERAKMFTGFFNDLSGGYRIKPPGKNQKFVTDKTGNTYHKIQHSKTTMIWINHAKTKIGIMFGERTYTPTGDAINFITSMRIGLSLIKKKIDSHKQLVYKIIQIKAVKNKCGIPLKTVQVKMFLNGMIEPIDEGELEIDPSEEITHKLEPDSQDESTFTEVAEDTPKPARKKKRKKKTKTNESD